MQPTLMTDRLTLRPVEAADAALIERYCGAWEVARMTTKIPHPYPPGAARSFLEATLAGKTGEDLWAIVPRASGAGGLIGAIALRPNGEVGYWIAHPFWQTGFATEAVAEIVAHAGRAGFETLRASVFQDNSASARVLTKNGFDYVGDGREYSQARGAEVDIWRYIRELVA